jgi:hypothetical protein
MVSAGARGSEKVTQPRAAHSQRAGRFTQPQGQGGAERDLQRPSAQVVDLVPSAGVSGLQSPDSGFLQAPRFHLHSATCKTVSIIASIHFCI